MCEVQNDVLQKLQADFVYDNGIVETTILYFLMVKLQFRLLGRVTKKTLTRAHRCAS